MLVTAIVEVGKEPFLYRGYVGDFHCNADGSLDRLVLEEAHRRQLHSESDKDGDDNFYRVEGHAFVLPYRDTKTLTIGLVGLGLGQDEADAAETLEKLLAPDGIAKVEIELEAPEPIVNQ